MRFGKLILWDMKVQRKSGFYLLYGVLTILYLTILLAIPDTWRETAAAILIFSDPAAMGLFFMGAIVLLEKSQRVPYAFAVSPVRAIEYIAAKTVSLCVIAVAVASVLAIAAKTEYLLCTFFATALSSMIFTLLGMIIATKITSLNQFILWTIPIELLCFVPAVFHLFRISPDFFRTYPINVCMDMTVGREVTGTGILMVLILILSLLLIAHKCVRNMWQSAGGITL